MAGGNSVAMEASLIAALAQAESANHGLRQFEERLDGVISSPSLDGSAQTLHYAAVNMSIVPSVANGNINFLNVFCTEPSSRGIVEVCDGLRFPCRRSISRLRPSGCSHPRLGRQLLVCNPRLVLSPLLARKSHGNRPWIEEATTKRLYCGV
jgi:hypothetical protein